MPCSCGGKAAAGRKTYYVIAENGKSVFDSSSKATADAVARRYPNSKVQDSAPSNSATQVPSG